MDNQKDILLTTHQLTVGYKQRRRETVILEDVNISLKRGELICLMGQNGVGKSTLLRTLSGVQAPLSGEVKINGQNIHFLSRNDKAKTISLVLTERLNAGNLTVAEVVAMGRYPFIGLDVRLSDEDKVEVDKAINLVNIRDLLDRPVHQLSDGQLQKVMIARALAQDGDIIILDEPTAHLDLNNRVAVIRLLKTLAVSTNKLVLMATHELDLALQTADRIILVGKEGEISEGIPEDLVLNGTMDKVFDLKGYDLKTGKYQHEHTSRGQIMLKGEGYAYLWTKNALERVGYSVADNSNVMIEIILWETSVKWRLITEDKEKEISSIGALIEKL